MREIKFRAWDKVLGQMEYDFTAIEFDIFSQKDNEWQDSISKISYIRNENWQTDSNTIKELVIMQFTGLIDKNGKEIYEGDILKANNANTFQYGNPDYKGIYGAYEIIFFDGSFYLKGLAHINEW